MTIVLFRQGGYLFLMSGPSLILDRLRGLLPYRLQVSAARRSLWNLPRHDHSRHKE